MFRSFLQAGFESSSHKNCQGRRLDLIRTTRHEHFAKSDYQRLNDFGINTVRIAARWYLIEEHPGNYDFQTLAVLLQAADDTDTEVLLDLLHFGWPDHVDVFGTEFAESFARFTLALVRFLKRAGHQCKIFAPVNEISFLSWAGGDVAALNPHTIGRGSELKRNLVRAAAQASEVLLNELATVRLISPEPAVHIVGEPDVAGSESEAAFFNEAQFQAWDMLSGKTAPELGGRPEYLDILGVNFYDRNQWVHNGATLRPGDSRYRPFRDILREIWTRYERPLFVAETGTENEARRSWFRYVCQEVRGALGAGVPVEGICLYPILNHPGWDDDRHCQNGLFDDPAACGDRQLYVPLAEEILEQQQEGFVRRVVNIHELEKQRHDLFVSPEVELRFPTAPASDESLCA